MKMLELDIIYHEELIDYGSMFYEYILKMELIVKNNETIKEITFDSGSENSHFSYSKSENNTFNEGMNKLLLENAKIDIKKRKFITLDNLPQVDNALPILSSLYNKVNRSIHQSGEFLNTNLKSKTQNNSKI